MPALRAFRSRHEEVRGRELGDAPDAFQLQLRLAAEGGGHDPERLEHLVREWMVRRPGRWLSLFRRRPLLREVERFRAAGGRTAVVSDYPAREKLAAMGVASLFEVVVASGDPGGPRRLKPEPDGYLAAAEALGVAPTECLVLGDREDADGEAARRAGMGFRRIG